MSDPDPKEIAWDERLRREFRAASLPTVPSGIATRVRRRLWRRRVLRVGAEAAAVLLTAGLLWTYWPRLPDRPGADRVENPPAVNDVLDPSVLLAGPPVDGLDVLGRQQSAYLDALGQAKEQDR